MAVKTHKLIFGVLKTEFYVAFLATELSWAGSLSLSCLTCEMKSYCPLGREATRNQQDARVQPASPALPR